MSNHLGNVLATVSDKLRGIAGGAKPHIATHYEAEVRSASDYYPFGWEMPGRKIAGDYRYGFNGMEKDDEMKGYTSLFRQYNPRIGRWISTDPMVEYLPSRSPYEAFHGNPILFQDADGHIAPLVWAAIAAAIEAGGQTAVDAALGGVLYMLTGVPYNGWSFAGDFATNLIPGWGEYRTSRKVAKVIETVDNIANKLGKITGIGKMKDQIKTKINSTMEALKSGQFDKAKGRLKNVLGYVEELRMVNVLTTAGKKISAVGVAGKDLITRFNLGDEFMEKRYLKSPKKWSRFKDLEFDILEDVGGGKFRIGEIKSSAEGMDKISKTIKVQLNAISDMKKAGAKIDGFDIYIKDKEIKGETLKAAKSLAAELGIDFKIHSR